jgi:hypothetical protein
VFPKTEPDDKRLFELLKKAYIDARYSMSYRITPEELTILQERVVVLAERVRGACLEKIATFCGPESVNQNLPMPPQLQEPLLANLPPPPSNAAEFTQWAGSLIELSEHRGRIDGRADGLREGEAVGIARGRIEGKAEGEAVGVVKGKVEGEVERGAADILMVLRTRGIDVSEEVERRILACSDPVVLSRWLQRAVTVSAAVDVVAA